METTKFARWVVAAACAAAIASSAFAGSAFAATVHGADYHGSGSALESGDIDVLDVDGVVDRKTLARKAFASPAETRKLNRITQPRIEDVLLTKLDEFKAAGCPAVVVEYSVFRDREMSLACRADVVAAVLAPVEERVKRAVASGFEEDDVRRRIAQQITDAERIEKSDVVFNNDGTKEELYNQVVNWWNSYNAAE